MSESNLIYHLDTVNAVTRKSKNLVAGLNCPFAQRVGPRRTVIDYDYVDQLDKQQLAYLKKFTDEYYGAGFSKNPIQDRSVHYKNCTNRNNCQNRDVFAKMQVVRQLIYVSRLEEFEGMLSL